MEDHFLEGLELSLFGLKGRFKEGTLDFPFLGWLIGLWFGYLLWG